MENCEVLNLSLSNSTDEKVTTNILDCNEGNSTIQERVLTYIKDGKIFNTTQGAGSGSQLPSLVLTKSAYNTTTNFYYVSVFSSQCIWVYDVDNDVGSIINSATPILGDSYPAGVVSYFVAVDEQNNKLFATLAGGTNGFWIYDIDTNTGKLYTNSGGVSFGDDIPAAPAAACVYDPTNNICYVAGTAFLWKLELDTNTGTDVSIVSSGDNYPAGGSLFSMFYDINNNLVWVGKNTPYGLYKYDPSNDSGLQYTTSGGAGSGEQLPNNRVNFQMTKIGNVLYVPTEAGIWLYDIDNDSGSVINTSTSFEGTNLPGNSVQLCLYSSFSEKLYVGCSGSLWVLTISTNTGEIITTADTGDNRPGGISRHYQYVDGVLWDMFPDTYGVWKYHEYNESYETVDIISSNNSNSIDYDYILNSLEVEPIKVNKIVFYSSNSLQKSNNIKKVVNTMFGDSIERQIQILDFEDPMQVDNKVHIIFDEPIIISSKEFFQTDLEAQTSVEMIFYYCQDIVPDPLDGFIEGFEDYPVEEEIKEEVETVVPKVAKSTISCAVKPFIILLVIYLIYKFFKKRK